MKTRGIFYFLMFVLILSLLGVEGCPQKKAEVGALGAYIGGTNGLDISFVDLEPPDEILDNNQDVFYITLFVENMGEYTIPNGRIIASLSGINKDAFGLKSLNVKSVIEVFGKSKIGDEVIEGGLEELQFDKAVYKHDLSADFATQLRADVCYAYQTNSLIGLCLKKSPIQRKQEDLCSVSGDVRIENSGAPLQVRDVKSRGGSDSVTFTFVIENKGSGDVYETETFSDECIAKIDKKNRVNVRVLSKSGDLNVKCGVLGDSGVGVVRLVNGMKTVSCNVRTGSLQEIAFEEPFEIVLNYFYKESIGKSLTIIDTEY